MRQPPVRLHQVLAWLWQQLLLLQPQPGHGLVCMCAAVGRPAAVAHTAADPTVAPAATGDTDTAAAAAPTAGIVAAAVGAAVSAVAGIAADASRSLELEAVAPHVVAVSASSDAAQHQVATETCLVLLPMLPQTTRHSCLAMRG